MESNTIEQVVEQCEYPKEILNFLILYSMSQSSNHNKVPHFNFIESVYVSWKRENVKTFADAINMTKRYQENKAKPKNNKTNKNAKKEYEPDWLEDYMKEF
jgi:replication initiation and membrane attachment protein DnaB